MVTFTLVIFLRSHHLMTILIIFTGTPKRFVEMTVGCHIRTEDGLPTTTACNYRFICERRTGEKTEWIVNLVDHFPLNSVVHKDGSYHQTSVGDGQLINRIPELMPVYFSSRIIYDFVPLENRDEMKKLVLNHFGGGFDETENGPFMQEKLYKPSRNNFPLEILTV